MTHPNSHKITLLKERSQIKNYADYMLYDYISLQRQTKLMV